MLKRDFLEKPYDYMNDILLFLYNNKGQATRNELVDLSKNNMIIAFMEKVGALFRYRVSPNTVKVRFS